MKKHRNKTHLTADRAEAHVVHQAAAKDLARVDVGLGGVLAAVGVGVRALVEKHDLGPVDSICLHLPIVQQPLDVDDARTKSLYEDLRI